MLTDSSTANAVIAAAKQGKDAAFLNVSAIALFALAKTTLADDGKAWKIKTVTDKLRVLQATGGMDYKTAARHISFGLAVRTMVGAKFTEHARVKEISKADTIEAASAAMEGFLRGMGCRSAADIEKWAKGDGSAIVAADRKALLKAPPKKAKEAGKAEAESDLITTLEEFISGGASLADVDKALAWLTNKRQDLLASGAAALVHVNDEEEEEEEMRQAA